MSWGEREGWTFEGGGGEEGRGISVMSEGWRRDGGGKGEGRILGTMGRRGVLGKKKRKRRGNVRVLY